MRRKRFQMPLCAEGKVPAREGSVHKKKATEDMLGKWFPHLTHLNKHYINNVRPGMLVACDKCDKWRFMKDYEEECEVPEFFECSMWNISDGERGNCYIPQLEDEGEFTNERYTPGSLVWAKMCGYPRWPAMVEDDPKHLDLNKLQYCKDLETDPKYHVVFFGETATRAWIKEKQIEPFSVPALDRMPQNLDLRKALEHAVEAMQMKKEVRLMTFSFAQRFRQKRIKNGNNTNISPIRDRRANRRTSTARRRKRTSNGKLVATAKQNHQSLGNPLEQIPDSEIPSMKIQEDNQSRASSGEDSQNNSSSKQPESSGTRLNNHLPNEETDNLIFDENNNDKYPHKGNKVNGSARISKTKRMSTKLQGSVSNTLNPGTPNSDNEDDLRSEEHKLYAEFLDEYYPPFVLFKLRDSASKDDVCSEEQKLCEEFLKKKKYQSHLSNSDMV